MSPLEMEERFKIRYLSDLEFDSEETLEKIKKRSLKAILRKKHFLETKWRGALFQKDMEEKRIIPFEIKEVHPLIGQGVFTAKSLPFLTFVGEYTGIVRKRRRREDRTNEYIFGYTIGPKNTAWVIDAQDQGNFTRFINHSYTPNLTSTWIVLEGISHVVFFTNRLIHEGEQLTYDYGPYYWSRRPIPFAL